MTKRHVDLARLHPQWTSETDHLKALLLVLLLAVFVAPAAARGQTGAPSEPLTSEAYQAVAVFFQYDKTIPLDAHVLAKSESREYTREKIVFTGGRGDRVPGILAVPKVGTRPYPLVLELHAGASSKDGWWSDGSFERGQRLTQSLLSAGVAVLALDAQYHGERSGAFRLVAVPVDSYQLCRGDTQPPCSRVGRPKGSAHSHRIYPALLQSHRRLAERACLL